MKELKAYLNWALNETHVSAAERADRAVNTKDLVTECWPDWVDCVVSAAESVYYRANGEGMSRAEHEIAWCLEHQPAAFGALALAFAVAVEAMHAAVPARLAEPAAAPRPDRGVYEFVINYETPQPVKGVPFRREYLGTWAAPSADAGHERWRDWLAAKPVAPSAMASRRAEAAADAVHERAKNVEAAAAPTGCAELRRADTGDLVKVKYRVTLQDMYALSAPDGHYWLFRV